MHWMSILLLQLMSIKMIEQMWFRLRNIIGLRKLRILYFFK